MFPTKEKNEFNQVQEFSSKEQTFKSIDQFSLWLDAELEDLVSQFSDFETDKSVRKFFTRS